MKILVTGGSGFIGSHLTECLVRKNHEVIITASPNENKPKCQKIIYPTFSGIDWNLLNDIEVVFHMAAITDTLIDDTTEMWRANVYAPMQLFKYLVEHKCKKFIYASTAAVYGKQPVPFIEEETKIEPLNVYAKSKAAFEKFATKFAEEYDVPMVGLRFCNIYGPGEDHKGHSRSMVRKLIQQIKNGECPKLFKSGEQKRDWLYVKDAIDTCLLSLKYTVSGNNIFNIGSGISTSFNKLVKIIKDELWQECFIDTIDFKPHYIDNPYKKTYQSNTELSIEKACMLLAYKPLYDLAGGIRECAPY